MEAQFTQCINKGMQRDYSVDKTPQEYAYENKNIRITTTGNESFLTVTNERSTIDVSTSFTDVTPDVILNITTIEDYIVLFGITDTTGYIYRGEIKDDTCNFTCIYKGNDIFNKDNPIETTCYIESEDVIKVYWVDGKTPPKYINIKNIYEEDACLEFIPIINKYPTVDIVKNTDGSGKFPNGTIQYFITYYNKYGSESNIVYNSSIYYLSPINKGGKVDDTNNCSFTINISNLDKNFDHIRVYAATQITLGAEPVVRIVEDISIKDIDTATVIDTNISDIIVESSKILFLGGNQIIASTIEQKDNTLFLGNIITAYDKEDFKALKEIIKQERENNKLQIEFFPKPILKATSDNSEYYYAPQLSLSSKDITGFKYLEWYRFGIQLQNKVGEWSNVIYLNDVQNTICPNIEGSGVSLYPDGFDDDYFIRDLYDKVQYKNYNTLSAVRYVPSEEVLKAINNLKDITRYRLVMAEHNDLTRTIKSQGYVLPTLFNLKERYEKTCFGTPIWSLGQALEGEHLKNVDYFSYSKDTHLSDKDKDKIDKYNTPNPIQFIDQAVYSTNPVSNSTKLSKLESAIVTAGEINTNIPTVKSIKAYCSCINQGLKLYNVIFYINIEYSNNVIVYQAWKKSVESANLTDRKWSAFGFNERNTLSLDEQIKITWDEISSTTYNDLYFREEGTNGPLLTFAEVKLDFGVISGISGSDIIVQKREYNIQNYIDDAKNAPGSTIHRFEYFFDKTSENIIYDKNEVSISKTIDTHKNEYFLDASTCSFYAPNIDKHESNDYKFRIVGKANVRKVLTDYNIEVEDSVYNTIRYDAYKFNFNYYKYPYKLSVDNSNSVNFIPTNESLTGVRSFPLFPFGGGSEFRAYWIYPWQTSNGIVLNEETIKDENGKEIEDSNGNPIKEFIEHFKLKSKTLGNMWMCDTTYLGTKDINNNIKIKHNKAATGVVYIDDSLYKKDYDNSLMCRNYKYYIEEDTSSFKKIQESLYENLDNLTESNINKEVFDKNKGTDVRIKFNTCNHRLIQFDKVKGKHRVLPGYVPNKTGNKIIYEDFYSNSINSITAAYNVDNFVRGVFKNNVDYYVCSDRKNFIFKQKDISGTLNTVHTFNIIGEAEFYGKICINKFIPNTILMLRDINSEADYNLNNLLLFELRDYSDDYIKVTLADLSNIDYLRYAFLEGTKGYFYSYDIDDSNSTLTYVTEESIVKPVMENKGSKVFIGELFIDYNKESFMGGNHDNAIELNKFISIGEPTAIGDSLYGMEGDTYYQRWDNLRLYPKSEDDINKIVDAVSIMLETHINLDGDTREARGRSDIINLRPSNMEGTINDAYSNLTNDLSYYVLDEKYDESNHYSKYWYSLTKQSNSDIDPWTSINLANVKSLDSDYGPINKIKSWNDKLYTFQDKAIALINYNNQTVISSNEGVPVIISNSGKVTGHYYITTNNGCKNKWSIVESPNGLYFIDGYNKNINLLNDNITSLSNNLLFHDWINKEENGSVWNPINTKYAFKSFYDPINKDVYFINGKDCLCYSELLQQFTSFYNYESLNYMFNDNGHIYGISNKNHIYKMFEGKDYCNLLGSQRDFYIKYKIVDNPFKDKVWTNLEYRADVFDKSSIQEENSIITNDSFDTVKVWNEYQTTGECDIKKLIDKPSILKNKFRIWRLNIPRSKNSSDGNRFGLDRIRNPWVMLELKKNKNTNKRMEFHDLLVKYLM